VEVNAFQGIATVLRLVVVVVVLFEPPLVPATFAAAPPVSRTV